MRKKIGELNSFISEIASESKYQEVKNELETKNLKNLQN